MAGSFKIARILTICTVLASGCQKQPPVVPVAPPKAVVNPDPVENMAPLLVSVQDILSALGRNADQPGLSLTQNDSDKSLYVDRDKDISLKVTSNSRNEVVSAVLWTTFASAHTEKSAQSGAAFGIATNALLSKCVPLPSDAWNGWLRNPSTQKSKRSSLSVGGHKLTAMFSDDARSGRIEIHVMRDPENPELPKD